jgi:hypothetical protein
MKIVRVLVLNLLLTLALLEVGLFAAARSGLVAIDLPSYSFANVVPFWRDSNPDFGVWHPVDSAYRHLKSCFDITYRSNSQGMRDTERPFFADTPRVAVLGDSFVEGFGVEQQDRFTDRLEARTGVPHLNFGTSGNFGLTQSWLLYKSFAGRFRHDAVILAILPDNDFSDDDFAAAERSFPNRYRPYLVGAYPDYALQYTNPGAVRSGLRDLSKTVEQAAHEFSNIVKAYSFFDQYLKMSRAPADKARKLRADGKPGSKYYDFTEEEFSRLRYAVEQIVKAAAPRPVVTVGIPRLTDYRRARTEAGQPPLSERLEALSAAAGFQHIDLLERTRGRNDADSLFHTCDPHWSARGHEMAAAEIAAWPYYRRPDDKRIDDSADMPVGALPSGSAGKTTQ